MKILIVTNMYPFKEMNYFGNFLKLEVEHLESRGLNVDVLFLNGRKNKFEYFLGLIKFLKVYQKYDIIHYHHSYIAWYSFFAKGKRQIFTIHEGGNVKIVDNQLLPWYGHGRKAALENIFKKFNLREKIFDRMDRIILTRYSKRELWYKGKKVIQNPMGIDFSKFRILSNKEEAREKLGISKEKIVLFFPHEPRKEKNVELFYQIVNELKTYLNNEAEIETVYGGKISAAEMYIYLNASDICFLTSKFEASPTIVKEAMACGVPILCTNVGDLQELLVPNYSRFICTTKEDFVQRALNLIASPPDREDLREFLRSRGMEFQRTSDTIIELYKEVE